MTKKALFILLLVMLPLLLGALASVIAQAFLQPVPLLVFKIDIGMVAFVFGAFISLLLAAFSFGAGRKAKQVQRSIVEAQRKAEEGRRRFLRRLDHEIKNPLTALRTALVNVRESLLEDERQRATENAGRAVERLIRLLADLRKLSDLGERPLERLPVDVPELLQEMVDAAKSLPAYQGREVNLLISKVPSPFPPVTGDRDLLALAVYNLVENALKFTSGKEAVEVRALEDGKAIVIEVADSGPGIPSDELSKIFEELYRGLNARGIEGSGLGLALVQRIVELHDGQIQVRSRQDEPRGTVFTLRLPVRK
ncbi:MAG: HAMP domain-containing histidine kinase [Anaerolineales bacterium]|nr:HAMP domain-containing histidine kinase [Anaerolineales bacterium]